MLHEPATPAEKDHAVSYKTRLGIWMFIPYSLFYAAFVVINLIAPQLIGKIVFKGLNLATVYGFALIIIALIEALVYDRLCRNKEMFLNQADSQKSGDIKSGPQGKA